MHIRVPQGMQVFSSGSQGEAKPVILANGKPGDEYDFNWEKPGFPGTVIAGRYVAPVSSGPGNVKVYLTASHQQSSSDLAQTAACEYDFFTASFGAAESSRLNVVELPDGTLTSVWAPELAAIPSSRVGDKSGIRLLASTIARQWWGSEVSPRTLNDAWITNGMARYSELLFVENQSGKTALQTAIQDVAAGALAYDTIPLSSAGRIAPFSPEFQSMTLEKGAMIFHMLRWEIGDKAFLATLKGALSQYAGSSMRAADLEKVAEAQSQQPLTAFFAQWLDGTGAPQFTNKYAIYRLGNNKGFRVIGEIEQDLDLFRMPVELSVETEGKTETKKIEVVGASTPFSVDTFGRPRRIIIDPQGWVLKSTPSCNCASISSKASNWRPRVICPARWPSTRRPWKSTRRVRSSTSASAKCSSRSATIKPASTPTGMLSAATASRAGPRFGAILRWARSSTSPASATALSMSIAWRRRPTTIARARSTKPGKVCKSPTRGPKASRGRPNRRAEFANIRDIQLHNQPQKVALCPI